MKENFERPEVEGTAAPVAYQNGPALLRSMRYLVISILALFGLGSVCYLMKSNPVYIDSSMKIASISDQIFEMEASF